MDIRYKKTKQKSYLASRNELRLLRTQMAQILTRIEALEKDSHPAKDLCEFQDYIKIDQRLERIEQLLNDRINSESKD